MKLNACAMGDRQGNSIFLKAEVSVSNFYHVPKGIRKNETRYQHQNLHNI